MSPILSVLLITTVALVSSLSPLISERCTTDSECPQEKCCVLGLFLPLLLIILQYYSDMFNVNGIILAPIRYAMPSCIQYQRMGEQCRVNASTITTNLSYPDNSQLEVKDVNYIMCPCAEGTSCNPQTGLCN